MKTKKPGHTGQLTWNTTVRKQTQVRTCATTLLKKIPSHDFTPVWQVWPGDKDLRVHTIVNPVWIVSYLVWIEPFCFVMFMVAHFRSAPRLVFVQSFCLPLHFVCVVVSFASLRLSKRKQTTDWCDESLMRMSHQKKKKALGKKKSRVWAFDFASVASHTNFPIVRNACISFPLTPLNDCTLYGLQFGPVDFVHMCQAQLLSNTAQQCMYNSQNNLLTSQVSLPVCSEK